MVALLNKVKGASFTSSKSAFLQHSLSSKGKFQSCLPQFDV
jgi:hypothetical protein